MVPVSIRLDVYLSGERLELNIKLDHGALFDPNDPNVFLN